MSIKIFKFFNSEIFQALFVTAFLIMFLIVWLHKDEITMIGIGIIFINFKLDYLFSNFKKWK